MSEETNAAENKTPETVAPATQETSAPAQAAPSQPENTGQQTSANDAPAAKKESGLPPGLKTELHKLRKQKSEAQTAAQEWQQRFEKLEKLLQEKNGSAAPSTSPEPVGLFEDPDKRLAFERTKVKEEILTELRTMEEARQLEVKLKEDSEKTIKALLAKPEINGNTEYLEEINEIIVNDPKLSQVVQIAPDLAGMGAFEIWKANKGIDGASKAAANKAAASVGSTSSPAASTKGKLSVSEIQAAAAKLDHNDPQFDKKWAALMAELQEAGG